MNDFITLAEENYELKTKIVKQLEEILNLKQKLLEEIQYSLKVLKEKENILDKSIENNKTTIEIIEVLLISLEAMKKIMKNMPTHDPNRKILTDVFEEIEKLASINNVSIYP